VMSRLQFEQFILKPPARTNSFRATL